MTINVSQAIDLNTAKVTSVRRSEPGEYIDGMYVAGTTFVFKCLCSTQQPTPKELQILPEGMRNRDILKFISNKPLRGTSDRDNIQADVVRHRGKDYSITHEGDWNDYGHTTALGVRIK